MALRMVGADHRFRELLLAPGVLLPLAGKLAPRIVGRRCGQRRDSLMAGIWILWKGMMNGSVQLRRRWQSITGDGRRRLVLMKVRRQDP